jgi:hypothetical protein
MANPNAPFGFQILKTDGKENRVNVYSKDTGAALYAGDVVKLANDGEVVVAAAGDVILGVAAEYAAAATTEIAVYDDPSAIFIAQCDGDYQVDDVGQNANITATSADTSLKRSKHDVDFASFGVEAEKQFKVLGLYERGSNAVGSYAIVKVKPNHHFFASGVAGI